MTANSASQQSGEPPYRTPEGGFLAYCVVDGGTNSWLSVDEEMADGTLGFCVMEGNESAAVIDYPAVVALRDHLASLLVAYQNGAHQTTANSEPHQSTGGDD